MSAVEIIKQIAREETNRLHIIELGIVTSVFSHSDPGDRDCYECNVRLKNRDLELRRVAIATQHIGLTNAPNVGNLVLVGFINGNINAPVILGRLYNDEDMPPVNNTGEIVYESPDSEESGVRRLHMKFPGGTELTITDEDVKVEAGRSKITINAGGDVTIESGSKVELKADGDISITGMNVSIKGKQSVEVKADMGSLDLKGTMVNIN